MKTLRVALVGLGKMGLLHASILNTIPSVRVVALCDRSSFVLRFARRIFKGVRVVDSLEKLSDLDLDAIYVTTPIPLHFPVIKTIYLKGIASNVFVEKTLGSSYDEARKLCRLAEGSGVHMVGYQRRFAVTFRKVKELLSLSTIGDIVSFEAYAYSSDFINCGRALNAPRGGALRDLGSHALDLALWFLGDLKVDSAKLEFMTGGHSEDGAHFSLCPIHGYP